MIAVTNEKKAMLSFLFEGWEETMLWSYFQGYMGRAFANDPYAPSAAQIIVGSFCFFAGVPDEELVRNVPAGAARDGLLLIPRAEEWSALIETVYGARAFKTERFAIKKEPGIFDRGKLQRCCAALPEAYTLTRIGEQLYYETKKEEWSKDLTSQFSTFAQYEKYGIGVAALYQGRLAAGASSYTVYNGGIEIEIDTAPAHRRKGLATACGARLILDCLARGLYPSWDAHDLRSVALAEKLGYHRDHSYLTYYLKSKEE